MIGQTLTSGGRSVIAPIIWALLTLPFAIAAVTGSNPHFALAAAFPGVFLLFSMLRPSNQVTIRIDEHGLVDEARDRLFPYEAIQTLRVANRVVPADRKLPSGPLLVGTDSLSLRIPAGSETPRLYSFLLEQIPPGGTYEVPDKLQKHWKAETETFGEEMVWAYAGRTFFPPRDRSSLLITAALALIFTIWIVGGANIDKGEAWIASGIIGLVLTAIVLPIQLQGGGEKKLAKLARDSGLIISPRGLAMLHGPMSGKLRWDEIRRIDLANPRSFQLVAAPFGLLIHVDGAVIAIPDVFERPLAKIHQLMLRYWNAN